MKKEELVKYAREYIIEQVSEGFSFQEIKEKLLEVGYDEEIIKEALVNKESEEINELKNEIRKLRVKNAHLKKDFENCKEEKPHNNIFLIVFILIICCIVAFSFGYIFKDVLKKETVSEYMSDKFGDNVGVGSDEDIGINETGNGINLSVGTDNLLVEGFSEDINDTNENSNESISENIGLGDCVYLSCNAPNNVLPCKCGNVLADVNNPWCCASGNEIFNNLQNENCIFCGGFPTPPGSP